MKHSKHRHYKNETRQSYNYGEFVCDVCGQPITEITQAITDPDTGKPIHFDCAHARILEEETLPERSELIYLGKGTFGIVQFENIRNNKKFTILKTIDFELPTDEDNWRNKVKEEFEKTLT